MDDQSSELPATRKRPEDAREAGGSPPDKRPCVGPLPEGLLCDDEFGEDPSPCPDFEEALVSKVMKELEETMKGPIRSETTMSRMEQMSGPLVSDAGSSIMASVDIGYMLQPFYPAASTVPDGEVSGALHVTQATVYSGETTAGDGHGAATGKRDEEEEEEWLTRVLSGSPLNFELDS